MKIQSTLKSEEFIRRWKSFVEQKWREFVAKRWTNNQYWSEHLASSASENWAGEKWSRIRARSVRNMLIMIRNNLAVQQRILKRMALLGWWYLPRLRRPVSQCIIIWMVDTMRQRLGMSKQLGQLKSFAEPCGWINMCVHIEIIEPVITGLIWWHVEGGISFGFETI